MRGDWLNFFIRAVCLMLLLGALICPDVVTAQTKGGLYISTNPSSAEIIIDGKLYGASPAFLSKLTPGNHIIQLKKDGYSDITEQIVVEPNRIKDVKFTLKAERGFINVKSSPTGAEVSLDNRPRGRTPLYLRGILATSHQLSLSLRGHELWTKEIELKSGEQKVVSAKLTPKSSRRHSGASHIQDHKECTGCHTLESLGGKIQIASDPEGADVIINKESRGRTPLSLTLFPGNYNIVVVKPNYEPYQRTLELASRETLSFKTELRYKYDADDMVLITEGVFIMGNSKSRKDERPTHKVYLKAFYIDRHETTNAEYREFFRATGHRVTSYPFEKDFGKEQQPVVGVSWSDAVAYCRWAGKRLPTEAEWEKAARGTEGFIYPWGNNWQPEYANSRLSELNCTTGAGKYQLGISVYGIFDMAGNVWEWCADYYHATYYPNSPYHDPRGPKKGVFRALRGGSWSDDFFNLRTAARRGAKPSTRLNNIGFRCAKDVAR